MAKLATPWKVYVCPPRPSDGGHWQLRAKRRNAEGKIEETRLSSKGDEAKAERMKLPWELRLNSGEPARGPATLITVMDARIGELEREARAGSKSEESVEGFMVARKRLAPLLGDVPASDLTMSHLRAARGKLLEDELGPAAVNTYLRRAAACWSWALQEELVSRPWPDLRPLPEPPSKKRPLNALEIERLLAWARTYQEGVWYPILALIAETGRRVSEIARLRGRDVDRSTRELRVVQKGKRLLLLPISAELLPLIPNPEDPEEWLFPRPKNKRTGGGVGPARRDSVLKVIDKGIEAIGVVDADAIDTHSLRRSGASHGSRARIPADVLRRLTGHETQQMLARYERETVGDDLRAAQEQLLVWRRAEAAELGRREEQAKRLGEDCPPAVPQVPEAPSRPKAKAPAGPGLKVGVSGFEPETSSLSGRTPSSASSCDCSASADDLGDRSSRFGSDQRANDARIWGTEDPELREDMVAIADFASARPRAFRRITDAVFLSEWLSTQPLAVPGQASTRLS